MHVKAITLGVALSAAALCGTSTFAADKRFVCRGCNFCHCNGEKSFTKHCRFKVAFNE